MRITLDVKMKFSEAGYLSQEVFDALVCVYLWAVYGISEMSNLSSRAKSDDCVASFANRISGRADNSFIAIEIDCANNIGEGKIPTMQIYHSLAVIFAWQEYRWDDIEIEDSENAYSRGEPLGDFVDRFAGKFGVDRFDDRMLSKNSAGLIKTAIS